MDRGAQTTCNVCSLWLLGALIPRRPPCLVCDKQAGAGPAQHCALLSPVQGGSGLLVPLFAPSVLATTPSSAMWAQIPPEPQSDIPPPTL